ncbi:hypothetical protein QBC43DRAFT_202044 [Cladorrhinum sp. PSN259]|nr:hypothetical protein QBC43DRAFT_202044 [Cladorrhinum sp. PSN259]
MPTSERALADDKLPDVNPPAYEDVVNPRNQIITPGPPKLQILAATWGGVVVTAEIQLMVTPDRSGKFDTLSLKMHTIHTKLVPDPNIGVVKSLSVLYKYSDSNEVRLLNVPQFAPQIAFTITPTDHAKPQINLCGQAGIPHHIFRDLDNDSWRDAHGKVEILAAMYGLQRVQTPSVLEELARFFRGKRGQIRTTSEFFRASSTQAFVGPKKSWTVYFRLLSEEGGETARKIRCVTGWEDGALEVPWTL